MALKQPSSGAVHPSTTPMENYSWFSPEDMPTYFDSSFEIAEVEANFFQNLICCGQKLSSLHDIIEHKESGLHKDQDELERKLVEIPDLTKAIRRQLSEYSEDELRQVGSGKPEFELDTTAGPAATLITKPPGTLRLELEAKDVLQQFRKGLVEIRRASKKDGLSVEKVVDLIRETGQRKQVPLPTTISPKLLHLPSEEEYQQDLQAAAQVRQQRQYAARAQYMVRPMKRDPPGRPTISQSPAQQRWAQHQMLQQRRRQQMLLQTQQQSEQLRKAALLKAAQKSRGLAVAEGSAQGAAGGSQQVQGTDQLKKKRAKRPKDRNKADKEKKRRRKGTHPKGTHPKRNFQDITGQLLQSPAVAQRSPQHQQQQRQKTEPPRPPQNAPTTNLSYVGTSWSPWPAHVQILGSEVQQSPIQPRQLAHCQFQQQPQQHQPQQHQVQQNQAAQRQLDYPQLQQQPQQQQPQRQQFQQRQVQQNQLAQSQLPQQQLQQQQLQQNQLQQSQLARRQIYLRQLQQHQFQQRQLQQSPSQQSQRPHQHLPARQVHQNQHQHSQVSQHQPQSQVNQPQNSPINNNIQPKRATGATPLAQHYRHDLLRPQPKPAPLKTDTNSQVSATLDTVSAAALQIRKRNEFLKNHLGSLPLPRREMAPVAGGRPSTAIPPQVAHLQAWEMARKQKQEQRQRAEWLKNVDPEILKDQEPCNAGPPREPQAPCESEALHGPKVAHEPEAPREPESSHGAGLLNGARPSHKSGPAHQSGPPHKYGPPQMDGASDVEMVDYSAGPHWECCQCTELENFLCHLVCSSCNHNRCARCVPCNAYP